MADQPAETTKNASGATTLPALFDEAIRAHGARVAMKCRYPWGYQNITFPELGKLVSYLGTGLIAHGLGERDRVALLAENSPEWTIVYAAVASCRATIVPLDYQLRENEVRHLLMHSGARFLVTTEKIYNERIADLHLGGVTVVVIAEGESELGVPTLGQVMAEGKEKVNGGDGSFVRRKDAVSPEDIAAICYTSGTTGTPKGAMLLHRNITANVRQILARLDFAETDVFLSLLPLHHTFATTCNFLAPVAAGCTIVFGRSIKQRDIREDIEREGVTILIGVPLLFQHMAKALPKAAPRPVKQKKEGGNPVSRFFGGIASGIRRLFGIGGGPSRAARQVVAAGPFGRLKYMVSGAAALRPDIEDAFLALDIPMLQGYGLTEASPVISVNLPGKARSGTVGPPLPGIEAKIVSPDDEGVGELCIRGDNVMQGYYNNPQATAEVLSGGWLRTGDLGRIDEAGYITIAGRKKSVIVSAGGKNIHPAEIEALIEESPYVIESLVMGIDDRKGNVRLGAVVVPDYDALSNDDEFGDDLTEDTIRQTIAAEIKRLCEGLPDYKRVLEFQIRDHELPRTTTRKIKRHLVKWVEEA
ncbi:MAG: AMP-binding protein [Candidatus Krumholzibacteriota bacterium]|nr:AMP-binding protein [Candidatus Krumholzibacteriota bacterium]